MDGGRIGKIQVHQILRAVFQAAVLSEFQADPFPIRRVIYIPDETQVSVGYLVSVLRLHDTVSDTECLRADTHLILRGLEWIHDLPDGSIQVV